MNTQQNKITKIQLKLCLYTCTCTVGQGVSPLLKPECVCGSHYTRHVHSVPCDPCYYTVKYIIYLVLYKKKECMESDFILLIDVLAKVTL